MKIDVQAEKDTRNLKIDKVGVKKIVYPIIVQDRTAGKQATVAEMDIYVSLLHEHRGTHMSRFLEVLNNYHTDVFIDKLDDFLADIKKRLHSEEAYVTLRFPYFMRKKAPVTGLASLLNYNCFFESSLTDEFSLKIGVEVPVTSLCPCSKEISSCGAHNQRSLVKVTVEYSDFVWLEELIEIIENSASCEVYSLLKRPDEKFVTEKAYNNPMFVEDIVREIALKLNADKRILSYTVESENYESIHNHSAYAYIKKGF